MNATARAHRSVGWIGLGDQGVPLVRRLLRSDHDVLLWARRASSYEPFLDTAATACSTISDLGRRSDYVGICVTNDADVLSVVDAPLLDAMRHGSTVAIHSTVSPATCEQIRTRAVERGVQVIDAPVARDRADQDAARFTLLVGGDPAAVDTNRPVLEAMADFVIHFGPLGSGQLMKLLNNTLAVNNLALALEALDAGSRIGLDRNAILEALRHTSGGSPMVDLVGFYHPEPRLGYVQLLDKDIRHFQTEHHARSNGAESPLTAPARALVDDMLKRATARRAGMGV
jgi:3-hydroxyisobutyrate dehydrogenase-like beta-hydroxyacid dehydrogenase